VHVGWTFQEVAHSCGASSSISIACFDQQFHVSKRIVGEGDCSEGNCTTGTVKKA